MPRTMFDSTVTADLPAPPDGLVAAYVDGRFANVDAVRRRFPKARVVTITVTGRAGAHVCDTEPGNIGPAGAARWAKAEVAAGRPPTLYCMASQWSEVKAAVKANGIADKVSYWIAQYDGKPTIPAGAVAKQYASSDVPAGQAGHTDGHKDVSVVADHWPGVDPAPRTRPLSATTRAAARLLVRRLNRRRRPLTPKSRDLLKRLRSAVNHALGVK